MGFQDVQNFGRQINRANKRKQYGYVRGYSTNLTGIEKSSPIIHDVIHLRKWDDDSALLFDFAHPRRVVMGELLDSNLEVVIVLVR